MKHNLLMSISIALIILAIILPITFMGFSVWWLLSGDMVSRLTWFNTSVIITIVTIITLNVSRLDKRRGTYTREIGKENILKKIYNKLFKF
jgi:hypothetical protein